MVEQRRKLKKEGEYNYFKWRRHLTESNLTTMKYYFFTYIWSMSSFAGSVLYASLIMSHSYLIGTIGSVYASAIFINNATELYFRKRCIEKIFLLKPSSEIKKDDGEDNVKSFREK